MKTPVRKSDHAMLLVAAVGFVTYGVIAILSPTGARK
ncbi:hypothetical protein CPT_Moonbeam8 [Bacillus phage Moonbeam]|uniref:Uncharacterized protein n=1 Tax=Bacillus phage Moonbeam TaxID=1540091 RepID=A0A0A0RSC1_9CAUD|nr:hypothetical protein CPT_Moonbeam8 [Bacillus phage Moonbeam]AIW03406.1 hypothetical protein CPT_Moonbeam8 [Bacillus phage Moonbeam]